MELSEETTMEAIFSKEEIAELRLLLDIEKIKKVKMMYSHLMDSGDMEGLAQIVAEDAVCEFGPYGTWCGRDEIYAGWCAVFKDAIPYGGFHATTNMWVEMTGETTAISRTYLHDISNKPDPRADPIVWYGVYDEDYTKIGGAWKIQRCELQFLWPQRLVSAEFPRKMTPRALG
jgi:ketosteroid isomerase-like protein